MYNITNYVLDEVDLTSSFNFFTTCATTTNSKSRKKELHQKNYISMIVKILTLTRIKGAKTKRVGRGEEERTNPCKNYTSSAQEFWRTHPERARTMQDWPPPLFCPSWEHTLYGGYKTKTRHYNTRLSI
jgi:hypothetical protein